MLSGLRAPADGRVHAYPEIRSPLVPSGEALAATGEPATGVGSRDDFLHSGDGRLMLADGELTASNARRKHVGIRLDGGSPVSGRHDTSPGAQQSSKRREARIHDTTTPTRNLEL